MTLELEHAADRAPRHSVQRLVVHFLGVLSHLADRTKGNPRSACKVRLSHPLLDARK